MNSWRYHVLATTAFLIVGYQAIKWSWLAGQSWLIRYGDKRRGFPYLRPEPLPRSESVHVIGPTITFTQEMVDAGMIRFYDQDQESDIA